MTGTGALEGLLVADFSRVLAGPYCTMLLADMGADVIKVEPPTGDDTRRWLPPERDGVSTYFLSINRNKRSISLDFRDPLEAELARELAHRADIVIENFKPGSLGRYGLDYGSVSAANPGVIYTSINGFGSAEGAALPGYDLMVQALSGLMSLTGDAEGPAYRAGISVFDVMAGLHAAIGILAALNERHQSGRGQAIEISLMSSALSGLVNHSSAFVSGGVVPYRMGNAHPSVYPYQPLPTLDGELVVIAANNGQFSKLCEVLGAPDLPGDPRFAHNIDRTANREELEPLLLERLRTRTSAEWFDLLIAAGVPCAPIQTIDKGVAFAEQVGLDPLVSVGSGDDALPMVRNPISFTRSVHRYDLPPPSVDHDGDAIRDWLRKKDPQ